MATYTELRTVLTHTATGSWETQDLTSLGVPANAVVECVLFNSVVTVATPHTVGVRAPGSAVVRNFAINNVPSVAGADGANSVTLHVQANASSEIETFTSSTSLAKVIILGYWIGATYVEKKVIKVASSAGSWVTSDLSADVPNNAIAEMVLHHNNDFDEREAGVRQVGSSLERKVDLFEAAGAGGGVSISSMLVKADGTGTIEVFQETLTNQWHTIAGYFSAAPAGFIEKWEALTKPTASATWETESVPGGAAELWLEDNSQGDASYFLSNTWESQSILNVMMRNDGTNADGVGVAVLGIRKIGSSLTRNLTACQPTDRGESNHSWHVVSGKVGSPWRRWDRRMPGSRGLATRQMGQRQVGIGIQE